MKKNILLLFVTAIVACTPQPKTVEAEGVNLSEREEYRYDKALEKLEQVEALYERTVEAPNRNAILELLESCKKLTYDYEDAGMNAATMMHCDSLKMRIDAICEKAVSLGENLMQEVGKITLFKESDKLIEGKVCYPFYMKSGERLFFDISTSKQATAKLYNWDSESLIKTYRPGTVCDSLEIKNSGIYLLELTAQGKLYVDVSLAYRPKNSSEIYSVRPVVRETQVECKKNDFGAVAIPGIEMRKAFEEPRKITLRGQIKAAFSGNAKALVAVPVPAGATDLLYSMRIATSESARAEDGKFHDNLTRSYKRVKLFGLPVYEKSSSNGLLNTLLDDNRPIREEDAYCNMYVFRNKTQAKKFQDGTKTAAGLDYDVDYSTLGTQSCNGRIPVKGCKTIYLAFENERMRYTNYLWVEVEVVVPNTVYYTTKYSIK